MHVCISLWQEVYRFVFFFFKSTVFIRLSRWSIRVQREATQTKVWVEHSSNWPLEFHTM